MKNLARLLLSITLVLVAFGALFGAVLIQIHGVPVISLLLGVVLVAIPVAIVYEELGR